MISFVWSSKYPFIAGSGGSETYTAGQIRELIRRGIPTRIITIGHGIHDGRDDFPDIPFLALKSKEELAELDDIIVYVIYPLEVKTKHKAYAILHCPPPTFQRDDTQYVRRAFNDVRLITASKFAAGVWRRYLKTNFGRMPTVYPFADEAFGTVTRKERKQGSPVRILFAGRLKVDKGIYTLLAALHFDNVNAQPFSLTITDAGKANSEQAEIILKLLEVHPQITVVPARKSPVAMAELMAEHDIVVMPSTGIWWQELFGMLSIEAQHAGCRVVASRSGGLPETNIGGAHYVRQDDPKALAAGLTKAIQLGPLSASERKLARSRFTVKDSVDSLLKAIGHTDYVARQEHAKKPHTSGILFPKLSHFGLSAESAAHRANLTQSALQLGMKLATAKRSSMSPRTRSK